MEATLLQGAILGEARDAARFVTNITLTSTEYSIIGKNHEATILLWNEGSLRICGCQPEEAVGKANCSMLRVPEGVRDGKVQTILETFAELPDVGDMIPGPRGTRHWGRSQAWAMPSAPLVGNVERYVPQPEGSGT